MLFCFDFDDVPSPVLAAVRASAVGQLRLVAIRAFGQARPLQRIVSAPFGCPGLGVSSFRIRHFTTLSCAKQHGKSGKSNPRSCCLP